MSRSIRTLAAILFAIALLVPGTALAAPLPWDTVDVTVHTEQAESTMLISGTLPADAKLPAQVELAAPAGATVMWAGEILGGPVEQDPTVQYTKTTKGDTDVYAFTLTKARIGQIELSTPGVVAQQGSKYGVALKYTPSQDVKNVRLAVRMPAASQVSQEASGATRQAGGQANYAYYTKAFPNVKAGSPVDLSFVYDSPAAGAATATGGANNGSGNILGIVVVLIAAAGLGFMLMSVSNKMKTARSSAEEVTPARPARKKPAPAVTFEEDEEADDDSATYAESDDDEDEEEAPVRRGLTGPQKVGIAGALAAVVMIIALMGQQNSSAWVNGKLTKDYGGTDACTTALMPVTPPQGRSLEDVGPEMLKALTPVTGIKTATIDQATSQIEIQFCDSTTSEEAMRQALATTGVQLGASIAGVPADKAVEASGAPAGGVVQ